MRTSLIRAYGLYGAFFVKRASRYFCCPLSFHSFVRPASILPSRPHICIAVARSGGQGRHFFCAAESLSLTDASGGRLGSDQVVGRAIIRGEPAIGRDQSREPRLYSVEPVWVPTMKQSYASAGKAPRRRVHSPSGIAAIGECGLPPPRIVIGYPAHQAQSGAEPCLSFLVLECCSRHRPQLDTVRHLAGRDQAPQRNQQLARQCHDHRRLARAARPLGPRAIPARQSTVFLEH